MGCPFGLPVCRSEQQRLHRTPNRRRQQQTLLRLGHRQNNCSTKRYSIEKYDNIKQAVRDQVTKDGQWESSDVGEWTATFQLWTTAFEDRDTKAFDDTLDSISVEDNAGIAELTYYWQMNGNSLAVTRSGCP